MGKFIAYIAGFGLVLLIALEVFFRTIVPGPEVPDTVFKPSYGIFVNELDPKEGRYTYGKLAEIRADWQINAQGWNTLEDFQTASDRQKPAIALLGDSYVENLYLAPGKHLEVFLSDQLDDRYHVYAIGKRGTPLSHIIGFANYASLTFKPEYTLVMVNHRNIPESFAGYMRKPQAQQYVLEESRAQLVPAKPKSSSPLLSSLRHSRFYTYLRTNFSLGLNPPHDPLAKPANAQKLAQDSMILDRKIFQVCKQMVQDMAQAAGGSKVLYVLHPYRPSVYAGDQPVAQSRWLQIFRQALDQQGATYLDLNSHFDQVYRQEGKPFEFDINMHFNEYGTQVAADGMADWLEEVLRQK